MRPLSGPLSMISTNRNLLFALYSAALFAVNGTFVRHLVAYATDWSNTNASHILLIPFISGALLYSSRERIFAAPRLAAGPGLLLAGIGMISLVSAATWGKTLTEGNQLSWMAASMVGLWLGGFLFFFGAAAFRAALFPLMFLFFCAPIPSPVLQGAIHILQRGSADFAFMILKLTGTPIYREDFTFVLPGLTVVVAPECSGIRSGISLLILTLLASHLMLRSLWRWSALLLMAVPILFFKNALRIATLTLLAVHVDHRILTSQLHQEGGIPFFAVGLLLIYPVLRLLIKSERRLVEGRDSAQ
ncbi:MAG TPA: exosortase/archaeosortase family protein [Terriglobia bacterium]|nr:exosortase/archaeosortase family protein [Terriglobia bacterium]